MEIRRHARIVYPAAGVARKSNDPMEPSCVAFVPQRLVIAAPGAQRPRLRRAKRSTFNDQLSIQLPERPGLSGDGYDGILSRSAAVPAPCADSVLASANGKVIARAEIVRF